MAKLDLNAIGKLLSGSGVAAIAKRSKVKQADVAKVLSAGIPALLSGMADNASETAGAVALDRALQDHKTVSAASVGDFLKDADLKDGKKILGHVLGGDQKALIEKIAGDTGVTKAKTTTILALAAPLLLCLLSSQNSGSSGIFGLLGGLLGLGGSSGGGLLSSLLGGGNTTQTTQSTSLLGSLLGGGSSQPAQQQQQSSGLLDSFWNLFH